MIQFHGRSRIIKGLSIVSSYCFGMIAPSFIQFCLTFDVFQRYQNTTRVLRVKGQRLAATSRAYVTFTALKAEDYGHCQEHYAGDFPCLG